MCEAVESMALLTMYVEGEDAQPLGMYGRCRRAGRRKALSEYVGSDRGEFGAAAASTISTVPRPGRPRASASLHGVQPTNQRFGRRRVRGVNLRRVELTLWRQDLID